MSTTSNARRRSRRRRSGQPTVAQFRTKASQVGHDLQELGGLVTHAARGRLDDLRGSATELYQHGQDKVHDLEQSLERYVREQPVKSLLIAATVGLLVGHFWMRR